MRKYWAVDPAEGGVKTWAPEYGFRRSAGGDSIVENHDMDLGPALLATFPFEIICLDGWSTGPLLNTRACLKHASAIGEVITDDMLHPTRFTFIPQSHDLTPSLGFVLEFQNLRGQQTKFNGIWMTEGFHIADAGFRSGYTTTGITDGLARRVTLDAYLSTGGGKLYFPWFYRVQGEMTRCCAKLGRPDVQLAGEPEVDAPLIWEVSATSVIYSFLSTTSVEVACKLLTPGSPQCYEYLSLLGFNDLQEREGVAVL
jgi:hypothetical protein